VALSLEPKTMDTRKRPREELEQRMATQAAEIQALDAKVKALKAELKADAAWQEKQRLKRQEQDAEKRKLVRLADSREEVLETRYKRMRLKYTQLLRSIGGSPGGNSTSSSSSSE